MELALIDWLALEEEVGEGSRVGSLEMQETWSCVGPAETGHTGKYPFPVHNIIL